MNKWFEWQSFPNPERGGYLYAPFGPGVYDLKNRNTGDRVLCGKSKNVAARMSSLLPSPHGTGTRKNSPKRVYVHDHLKNIEYRTMACDSMNIAAQEEKRLKANNNYLFPT